MLKAANLANIPGLQHGFFTRAGGHSAGIYGSLNCGLGSNDDRASVLKNRSVCAQALGVNADSIVTVHQEHTATAVTATAAWKPENSPIADALASKTPELALAVLAADCVPILFAEPESRVIGAAHSGWKGALYGVIESTIETMIEMGAKRSSIVAAIGPCIGASSYEVGPEFSERFITAESANARYFTESGREGHSHFDIGGYVNARLLAAGVQSLERLDADTYTEEERFFSFRRSCHRSETDYGRQLSGIAWVP